MSALRGGKPPHGAGRTMDRDFVSSVQGKSVDFHFPMYKVAVTVSALLLP